MNALALGNMMNVSIGIPAFNEMKNLTLLLPNLVRQKTTNSVKISQILVVDDGSTDGTPDVVEKWSRRDHRVELYCIEGRVGQTGAINHILTRAKGDILVLLDADVFLPDEWTIDRLVSPFIDRSDLLISAGDIQVKPPQTLLERVAVFGAHVRNDLQNICPLYMVHCGYALSRALFDNLKIPNEIIAADAYLYLTALIKNCRKAITLAPVPIYYAEQNRLATFLRQRRRVDHSYKQLKTCFGHISKRELSIPKLALTRAIARNFVCDPLGGSLWLVLRLVAKTFPQKMTVFYRDR